MAAHIPKRVHALKTLLEGSFTQVPPEIKSKIIAMNVACRKIVTLYEKQSRTNEETIQMLHQTRDMLNFIITHLFHPTFPYQKNLVKEIKSSLYEVFHNFQNSKASIINIYGPSMYVAYHKMFNLNYELGANAFNQTLQVIPLFTNTTLILPEIDSIGELVNTEDNRKTITQVILEKYIRNAFTIDVTEPYDLNYEYTNIYITGKIARRLHFTKVEMFDIVKPILYEFNPLRPSERKLNVDIIRALMFFASDCDDRGSHLDQISRLRKRIQEPNLTDENIIKIGMYARQNSIGDILMATEIATTLSIIPNISDEIRENILEIARSGWEKEHIRLNTAKYLENYTYEVLTENRKPLRKHIISFIEISLDNDDLQFYAEIAYHIGMDIDDIIIPLEKRKDRDLIDHASDIMTDYYNKTRIHDILTLINRILKAEIVLPTLSTINMHRKWIEENQTIYNKLYEDRNKKQNLLGDILIQELKQIEILINDAKLEDHENKQFKEKLNRIELPMSYDAPIPMSKSSSKNTSKSNKYSSSYRHHQEYSHDREYHNDLEKLPIKTRQHVLKELNSTCKNMFNIFTQNKFIREQKNRLQLMVKLGRGEKRNCYYVRDIYDWWKTTIQDGRKFKDPLDNREITNEEMDDIMKKIKYIKYDAVDIREFTSKPGNKLKLFISQDFGDEKFQHVKALRKIGTFTHVLYDFGYIPALLEPSDFRDIHGHTSTDLSSSILATKIDILFEKGLLLINNTIPYKCCKIHLYKDKTFWTSINDKNDLLIKGISRNKFINMMNEVNARLGLEPHTI
jgi:hypothetical protein